MLSSVSLYGIKNGIGSLARIHKTSLFSIGISFNDELALIHRKSDALHPGAVSGEFVVNHFVSLLLPLQLRTLGRHSHGCLIGAGTATNLSG